MNRNLFYFIALSFTLLSCEETIQLDLDQTEPLLVIEGLFTTDPAYNYVKITKTSQFYEGNETPRVSGANVSVTSSDGETIVFAEEEPGWYFPTTDYAGKPGITYTLTIESEGQMYTATETLAAVNSFDSLTYWKPPNLDDQDALDEEQFYELLVFYTEPQDEENYYLFKFYRNEELLDFEGTAVFAFDDEALSENIEGIATPEYYALGDTGSVEVFSLSRKAFRYYLDLGNNLNNDGGLFSGIPANAGTNIVGNAIGYFQVSDMDRASIIIE